MELAKQQKQFSFEDVNSVKEEKKNEQSSLWNSFIGG